MILCLFSFASVGFKFSSTIGDCIPIEYFQLHDRTLLIEVEFKIHKRKKPAFPLRDKLACP